MIDKNAAHRASRHGKEMRTVVPRHIIRPDKSEIGLVDEDRRLDTVTCTFGGHTPFSNQMEFPMTSGINRSKAPFVASPQI